MLKPLKKLSRKEIKVKNKPWLNADILEMINIRNKVFGRKKRQPNNENCSVGGYKFARGTILPPD